MSFLQRMGLTGNTFIWQNEYIIYEYRAKMLGCVTDCKSGWNLCGVRVSRCWSIDTGERVCVQAGTVCVWVRGGQASCAMEEGMREGAEGGKLALTCLEGFEGSGDGFLSFSALLALWEWIRETRECVGCCGALKGSSQPGKQSWKLVSWGGL